MAPKRSVKAKAPAKGARRAKRAAIAKPVTRVAKPRPVVVSKSALPKPARPNTRPPEPASAKPAPRPSLDRERRRLSDVERTTSSETEAETRAIAGAKTGHDAIVAAIAAHHETSPALTAGDVDANWEDAYAIGDEAPGGDNPTPDQDRVDDIGKALGVTYEDNEELRGSDKIAERDEHRWEYDPASSEDWPHDK